MSPSNARRSIAAASLATVVALALAACATDTTSATSPAATTAKSDAVTIDMTSSGSGDVCTADHTSVAAGPVTFTVKNTSATGITEFELLSGQRILGEKENLAPGLGAVSFTSTLTGGTYQLYCPGAAKESTDLKVTGTAATKTATTTTALLDAGTTTYSGYVAGVIADMVTAVQHLQTAVDSGDVAAAKKQYAIARPFYEKVESDVSGFVLPGYKATDNAGNLDYLVDMRASNLDPKVGWHGFHAVERDLWQGGRITASTKTLAAELTKNVEQLSTLSKGLTYKPEDLANGAAGLLEEVQSSKIKGTEEAFSHLDLVDFAANVEGAEQAFANLQQGLVQIDPTLTAQVSAEFDAVNKVLDGYRDANQAGGYELYTAAIRTKDAQSLSDAVQGLQAPLSKIAAKVAAA